MPSINSYFCTSLLPHLNPHAAYKKTVAVIGTPALLLFFFMAPVHLHAETPAEAGLALSKQIEAANSGFVSEESELTMVLYNATGDHTERKMKSQIKEGRGSEGDKSLIEFTWPADVSGTKMLTWSHKVGNDDQWLFLPSIKRVKRISARNRSGSFMGSEFSYEDLGSDEIEQFTYKKIGEETILGRKTWILERFPKDKKSGYSKQKSWIDQEYFSPLKMEYYDRKGELLKVGEFSGYTGYETRYDSAGIKKGKIWRAGKIEVKNVQTKKRSVLTWSGRTLGVALDEDTFDSDALKDD